MIFNSSDFLIFLPLVFVAYWCMHRSKNFQNLVLLLASYIFYGWWDWRFLSLILISSLVDYFIGIRIHDSYNKRYRKHLLYLSIFVNIGVLGFFKYYNFFTESFANLIGSLGLQIDAWTLSIILPVGISFYTFQTLSYSIDLYNNKIEPTKNFIEFATFVAFFPQLVAGPIERAKNLLPQFHRKRVFSFDQAKLGFTYVMYGFFRKVVVADRLAIYVNSVYGDIDSANSLTLVIASVFFSFQIYCDFR